MNDSDRKLRYIYFPFFVCCVLVTGGYSFVRWFFDFHLGIIKVNTIFLDFIIPAILSVLVFILFLRKGIKFLLLSYKQEQFIQLIAIGTMFVPTLLLQDYLAEQSQSLHHVGTVYEIGNVRMTDCYHIDEMEVIKSYAVMQASFSTGGGRNLFLNADSYLYFEVFIAAPLTDSPVNFGGGQHRFWYGYYRKHKMSNYASDEEKSREYRLFQERTWNDFMRHNAKAHTHLKVVNFSDKRNHYIHAIQTKYKEYSNEVVIMEPEKGFIVDGKSKRLIWVFVSLAIGLILFIVLTLFATVSASTYGRFKHGERLEQDSIAEALRFLTFRTSYRAIPLLVNLNLLIFIIMGLSGVNILQPTGEVLLKWGALRGNEFFEGEYWRLASSMFIHTDIMHLIYNCFGLGLVGFMVEPLVGSGRFLLIYLLSGLSSGLVSLWWDPTVLSVGASGAIFGIIGLLFVVCFKRVSEENNGCLFFLALSTGGVGLLEGIFSPNIDNAAHIGGIVSGLLFSFLLTLGMKRRRSL